MFVLSLEATSLLCFQCSKFKLQIKTAKILPGDDSFIRRIFLTDEKGILQAKIMFCNLLPKKC